MGITALYNLVKDWFWEAGGIGAALDLGLDDLGYEGYEPCPCKAAVPRTPLEAAPCPLPCSNSLPRPLSR